MFGKILVVEDDGELRKVLTDKLMLQHHEIIQAEDGEQAVAKFKTHRPDLVILDLLLPKLNGFEVLGQLRQEAGLSKTPVIIYSNLNKPESVNQAKELQVTDYYVKAQTKIDDLCLRIDEILNQN